MATHPPGLAWRLAHGPKPLPARPAHARQTPTEKPHRLKAQPPTFPLRQGHLCAQAGQSLLSLMLGMGLGLLVVAAGIRLLGLQWQTQRQLLQQVALQQDLQTALGFVVQELQQAQQVHAAWQQRADGPCSDPLCTDEGALRLSGEQLEWATDRNRNGLRENNECSGLRLRGGVLQHKTACTTAVWTALTDPASLQLTRLDWQLQCRSEGQRLVRRMRLVLAGHVPQNPDQRLQVEQLVNLRNDLPLPAPGSGCPPV